MSYSTTEFSTIVEEIIRVKSDCNTSYTDDELCPGHFNCDQFMGKPNGILFPIILSLCGATGHVIALIYLYGTLRKSNSQKTVFHVLLCTLMWTDLVGKLLTTPTPLLSYSTGTCVSDIMCQYHGTCMIMISSVTHFLVAAMSIERFLGICHGYYYSSNVTPYRVRLILAFIWIYSIIFAILPHIGLGRISLQYPGTWCYVDIHVCPSLPWYHRYYTNFFAAVNLSNLIVLVSCNVLVVGSLMRMRMYPHYQPGGQKSQRQIEMECQMSIVLGFITVIMLISHAPLDLVMFTNQIWPHCQDKSHWPDLLGVRLASINQIADPWMYIILKVLFRSRLWNCCRKTLMGPKWSKRLRKTSFKLTTMIAEPMRKFSNLRTNSPEIIIKSKEMEDFEGNKEHCKEELHSLPQIILERDISSKTKDVDSDSGTGSITGMDIAVVKSNNSLKISHKTNYPSSGSLKDLIDPQQGSRYQAGSFTCSHASELGFMSCRSSMLSKCDTLQSMNHFSPSLLSLYDVMRNTDDCSSHLITNHDKKHSINCCTTSLLFQHEISSTYKYTYVANTDHCQSTLLQEFKKVQSFNRTVP
ncbi:unnamed protein product [Meganyctiphanes norvegica]|uniref:G-protein coupled receptors family 1 profile domain-containing protein n=1 Tax=Meganyctiphanes norvegica TaxID=48144 RepID=A0AAV2R327_MEGNR